MSLQDKRIWLVTRGGDRVPHYQSALLDALREAGARSVEVLGVESIVRQAAQDLGARAGEWIEGAAERLARGLRIDRLLRLPGDAKPAEGEAPADEGAPDLVVIDDPRLLTALRVAPGFRSESVFSAGLIDDFRVDTRWRGSAVQAIVSPHESLAAAYRSAQGPAIYVAGPPVGRSWAVDLDAPAARAKLGLPSERAIVVVSAERLERAVLERTVFQLTLVEPVPVVLFHVGASAERGGLLRESAADHGLPAQLMGQVDDPGPIYAAADVVLAPADDPTLFELIQCRRPVLLLGPDRGAARASFLSDQGATRWVEDPVELSTQLEGLLADGAARTALVARAAALVPADGAQRVVEALAKAMAAQAEVKATPPEAPAAPVAPSPAPAAWQGPFEPIGLPSAEARQRPAAPATLTAAEAKDQLAAMILKEREAERGLAEAVRARDRWLGRLELAKEAGDADLGAIAGERHQQAAAEVARLNGHIESIRRSKDKLKARVARPGGAPAAGAAASGGSSAAAAPAGPGEGGWDVEARFRRMEVDRDLARLRRKLDGDG